MHYITGKKNCRIVEKKTTNRIWIIVGENSIIVVGLGMKMEKKIRLICKFIFSKMKKAYVIKENMMTQIGKGDIRLWVKTLLLHVISVVKRKY